MNRVTVAVGFCTLISLATGVAPPATSAETVWFATGGQASWPVSDASFSQLGLSAKLNDAGLSSEENTLSLVLDSDFGIETADGRLGSLLASEVPFGDRLSLSNGKDLNIEITQIRLVVPVQYEAGQSIELVGRIDGKDTPLFTCFGYKPGFDPEISTFVIETSNFIASKAFLAAVGLDSNTIVEIPGLILTAEMVWAGGDKPFADESADGPMGAPRGGNGGTVCGVAGGPDVIVGLLYTGGGDNPASENVGGVWYDTFSVGTTSCNLGDMPLTWDSSTTVHPVIAQNLFRLKDGRFEQIGQSWLKHGFLALTQNECGCGCSGPGGSVLSPGCSDPYSPSLNNSQGSLRPKFRVNPTTGVHVHGSNPSFSGSVARRLEVRHTDIDPALNSGARYFIEGQYIQQEDAGLDKDDNNASHREVSITSTGTNEYSYSMLGQTLREQPAIRSWQTIDPTVVLSDAKVTNDGLYIVGSKVTDNGNGTWHYQYAIHNLNGNRGAKSFSIPISPSAVVSNIGFTDVDYHDGDGEGSVTRDGADWTATFADSAITWNMMDMGDTSNALLWGTMYTFRFDADIAPDTVLGNATLECFRPLAGNPDSFTAAALVPLPAAVLIDIAANAYPGAVTICTETTFPVRIRDGAETFDTGTAKLHYSANGGPFVEQPLTPLGGEMYEVSLPPAQCGDAPRFYLSAMSTEGTFVTNPTDAEGTNTFLTLQVGVDTTLIDTNFEGGLPAGWTIDGLWNISSTCSAIPIGSCGDSDGSNVAYYGQTATCNYDTGTHNSGSITTPEIDIPPSHVVTLDYCSAFERHTFPGGDLPIVRVTPQGGVPEIVDAPATGVVVSSPPHWEQRTVDLTPYAGQTVAIDWNFDNLVAIDDEFLGWMIDNVSLTAIASDCSQSCTNPDGDLNIDSAANGLDLALFTAAIIDQSANASDLEHADFNGSGAIDLGDVDGMVNKLLE